MKERKPTEANSQAQSDAKKGRAFRPGLFGDALFLPDVSADAGSREGLEGIPFTKKRRDSSTNQKIGKSHSFFARDWVAPRMILLDSGTSYHGTPGTHAACSGCRSHWPVIW